MDERRDLINMEYLQLPIKEKIIYIWIKHLYFEFKDYSSNRAYIHMINDTIVPMLILVERRKYQEIMKLCPKAIDDMKFINGNHYHMNLFIELEKLIREL